MPNETAMCRMLIFICVSTDSVCNLEFQECTCN